MDGQSAQSGRVPQAKEWRPGGLAVAALVVLVAGGGIFGYFVAGHSVGADGYAASGLGVGASMGVCWLVLLPLSQYFVMRRVGARPKPSWGLFYPNVFGFLRAVGHPFSRASFAFVCTLPFLMAWVIFPVLASLSGTWESVAVLVGLAMGVSLYFLWYAALALSKPRGTIVEELDEQGSVRFHEPASHARR
jgi:hypothetical protein